MVANTLSAGYVAIAAPLDYGGVALSAGYVAIAAHLDCGGVTLSAGSSDLWMQLIGYLTRCRDTKLEQIFHSSKLGLPSALHPVRLCLFVGRTSPCIRVY